MILRWTNTVEKLIDRIEKFHRLDVYISISDFEKSFSMWFNVVKTFYIILVCSIVIFTTTLLHVPMLGRGGNDNHRNWEM